MSSGLALRQERAPPPGVVAEDAGREESRRGKGEAAERAPDEVLAACHPGEGAAEGGVRDASGLPLPQLNRTK